MSAAAVPLPLDPLVDYCIKDIALLNTFSTGIYLRFNIHGVSIICMYCYLLFVHLHYFLSFVCEKENE